MQNQITQGCILICEDVDSIKKVAELRIRRKKSGRNISKDVAYYIVLSQDCDIHNSLKQSGSIEIVEAKLIHKLADERLVNNKNYKKLQLVDQGKLYQIEYDYISVVELADINTFVEDKKVAVKGNLLAETKKQLINWRIKSYSREPFPDKFNDVFVFKFLKLKEIENDLEFILKKNFESIDRLYAYVSPNKEGLDSYLVAIYLLVYENTPSDIIEELEASIEGNLAKLNKYFNENTSEELATLDLIQINDGYERASYDLPLGFVLKQSEISVLDTIYLRELNLEYICYFK